MPRCESCAKFVGLELQDPEVDSLDIDAEGGITAQVRIVRNCADCGTEMKEATFDLELEVPEDIVADHKGEGHELEVEEDGIEMIEEGGGRYKKSYYGAEVKCTVSCSCQKEGDGPLWEGTWDDKIPASGMDELY